MEYLDDKINCPYCNYPIPKDDVICPVCDEIIANYTSEVAEKETDEEVVKASSSYLHTYTTNPKIIMLLTFMFCLGVFFIFLFHFIEYRPLPRGHRYQAKMTTRQAYTIMVVFIGVFLSSNNPFENRKYLPQRLLEGKRVATLIFYCSSLLVLVLFWFFYVSDFISNDLNDFYYDKFYLEALNEELFVKMPEDVTIDNSSYFIDRASILAEQPAKIKTETYVRRAFTFYKTTYLLCVTLIYLPFIFYYGFNLDFQYSDVEPYKKNFTLVFGTLFVLISLYYFYKKSSSPIAFVVTLLLIGISYITSKDFKTHMIFLFILAIAMFGFIMYCSANNM